MTTAVEAQQADEDKHYLMVQPGQTLIKIMRVIYPDQRSRWPELMRKVVKLNPQAFEDGDPRKLKIGSRLELPEETLVKKVVPKRRRAGVVQEIEGQPTALDDKKKRRQLERGGIVYVGDQIMTGIDDLLKLEMIDGAKVELRCNSVLNIEEYSLRTRGSNSVMSLLKGSLHKETGRIGKGKNDRYVMRTPIATIGVRGTEYGVRVRQSDGCGGKADVDDDGLYVAVLSGEVEVQNPAGKIKVESGDAAHVAQNNTRPESYEPFSGMVFGEAKVETPVTEDDDGDGIPIWWMIVGVVILGIGL